MVIHRLGAYTFIMSSKKYDEHDLQDMAERAAGVVEERIKDDLQLVLEATAAINNRLDTMPTRNEFNVLHADVKVIKLALTDTNADVRNHEKRITKLETTPC